MGLLKVNRGLEKYFSKVELKKYEVFKVFSPKIIVQLSITNLNMLFNVRGHPSGYKE